MSVLISRLQRAEDTALGAGLHVTAMTIREAIAEIERLSAERVGVNVGVPEGWALVPKTATNGMATVGTEARWRSAVRDADSVREIWGAMVQAAPPVGVNVGAYGSTASMQANSSKA